MHVVYAGLFHLDEGLVWCSRQSDPEVVSVTQHQSWWDILRDDTTGSSWSWYTEC